MKTDSGDISDEQKLSGFAQRLRELRKQKGYTQEDLGKLADVHYVNLSRYERGLSDPSANVVKKLAEALEVSAGFLLEGEPGETKVQDAELRQQLEEIERLPEAERAVVKEFLDAFLFRHRIRGMAS